MPTVEFRHLASHKAFCGCSSILLTAALFQTPLPKRLLHEDLAPPLHLLPKGRSKYYSYYHCRNGCAERTPAEKAHQALLDYFDKVAVKPEVEKLYPEIMGEIFKKNESKRSQEIGRSKESLAIAEKYVLNEIECDSYAFMKPRLKTKSIS